MKLRKIVKVGATVQYEQEYAGGIEYRKVGTNSKRVETIYHNEGRFYNLNVETSNTLNWRKEYGIRDHLGNTRLMFADKNANGIVDVTNSAATSDILQESHYYPFGLSYEGPWLMNDAARDNSYQYNGKELNDDFGLNWSDYGARWYMPDIGRWGSVDPLAGSMAAWSPYSYTFNNPLKYTDPTGMAPLTDYFNLLGNHVKHVEDGKNDKVLVLTTAKKESKVDEAITSGSTINVPSNAVVDKMEEAYSKTESNGKEHGFRIGDKGKISIMVSGNKKEITSEDWKPAVADIVAQGDLVAYDAHTHPLEKDEYGNVSVIGLPKPSDTDKNNIVGSQPNVVLGYREQVTQPTATLGGTPTREYIRSIGFYRAGGLIHKEGAIDFKDFKTAVNKINKN